MGIDLERLGPAAQAQVKAELERRKRAAAAMKTKQKAARTEPKLPREGSQLERDYYAAYIWPRMLAGEIASCELQKRFELLPAAEYCGLRLPALHYTPDFLVVYANGQVEAVEVKHRVIRKLQRDYIYRRRLFIELIAKPKGWIFTEHIEQSEE